MTDEEKTAVRRKIAQYAQKALLYEVSVTPKPGLVDRADNGAHRDMDFFTFLDSAAVLTPYFEECAAAGLEASKSVCFDSQQNESSEGDSTTMDAFATLLTKLRGPGKEAEREMLRATGGVNTHKGAIFLLGLLSAAAGFCLGQERKPHPERPIPDRVILSDGSAGAEAEESYPSDRETICDDILLAAGRIAEPALKDFAETAAEKAALSGSVPSVNSASAGIAGALETVGLKAYRISGCTGIRGEAAAGFPSVKHAALPALKKALANGKSINDAGVEALLELILRVDDTTLLKRCGSREAVEKERTLLRELLAIYTPVETARHLNERWSEKGYSAGGCADLLGAAYFLLFMEKEHV